MNHSFEAEAVSEAHALDAKRLDWLQKVKDAHFTALNGHADIAAIKLWTVPSQHVRGNTIREVIDEAMRVEALRQQ